MELQTKEEKRAMDEKVVHIFRGMKAERAGTHHEFMYLVDVVSGEDFSKANSPEEIDGLKRSLEV